MKDKVIKMMDKVYSAMGGQSQTPLIVVGHAILGHVNNQYWDEKDIPMYCDIAVHEYWADISDDIDFLSSEAVSLEKIVKELLQKCKEKAGIA